MVLEKALHAVEQVMASIKFDEERRKSQVDIVERFVKQRLVLEMQGCSRLFRVLFREVGHVGSSYDNLRLDGDGDFDLNLVLKLDILTPHINLEFGNEVWPGYVNMVLLDWDGINIPENHGLSSSLDDLYDTFLSYRCHGEFVFNPVKVSRWLESLVQRALDRIPPEHLWHTFGINEIKLLKHGVAKTLSITMQSGANFEVDLVPVFDFPLERLFNHSTIKSKIANGAEEKLGSSDSLPIPKFYLVPKGERSWKISLALLEKKYLLGDTKPLIRLLKAFRDANTPLNSNMSSYSLKSLVMHLRDEIKDPEDWRLDNLHKIFLKALGKMMIYMDPKNHGALPNYWDGSNLWPAMNRKERKNKYHWLARNCKILDNNKENQAVWAAYFNRHRIDVEGVSGGAYRPESLDVDDTAEVSQREVKEILLKLELNLEEWEANQLRTDTIG